MEGADGLHPAHPGHLQVHQRHIRAAVAEDLQGLQAAGGFADQLHVRLAFDHRRDAFAQQGMVIDGQDADRHGKQEARRRAPGRERVISRYGGGHRTGNCGSRIGDCPPPFE